MIKRELYMSRIRPFIGTELVKVMTGIRRCGKSVMLELIQQELAESGVSRTQFISINFEDMSYSHLQTAQALHDEITARAAEIEGKVYLFFDEIQEVKGPLNSSISLNSAAYEDNDDMDKLEIVDLKAENDPSDIIANQEYSKTIERKIKENLSEYELSVLYEYEKGHSYADIAEKLKTKVKSVDTAIQRIKKKANKIKESIDS